MENIQKSSVPIKGSITIHAMKDGRVLCEPDVRDVHTKDEWKHDDFLPWRKKKGITCNTCLKEIKRMHSSSVSKYKKIPIEMSPPKKESCDPPKEKKTWFGVNISLKED